MDHCDDQFRVLSHDGLSPDYREGAERSLEQLARTLRSRGLDLVRPQPGEPLDDRLHRAVETGPPTGPVAPEHVLRCLRPGYRRGDAVLQRAEVCLALAPTPTTGSTEVSA